MANKYIGVMSGTSFDAVDAVIAQFDGSKAHIIASHARPIPASLKKTFYALSEPKASTTLESLYSFDEALGQLFADTVSDLLTQTHTPADTVRAIGLHGQTIRHLPDQTMRFTVQLGNPHLTSTQTGIPTVADFRRRDVALKGEGAPLAPLFHQAFLQQPGQSIAVVNIGGFANVTLLNKDGSMMGFDTGPGNALIDALSQRFFNQPFDQDGRLASRGEVNQQLLNHLLEHDFFHAKPPKSTGRDQFSFSWLSESLNTYPTSPQDAIATLTELTAYTIAHDTKQYQPDVKAVYVCGGGALNPFLLQRLQSHLPNIAITPTDALGIPAQQVEPLMMAWLAKARMDNVVHDLSSITGNQTPTVLGVVF